MSSMIDPLLYLDNNKDSTLDARFVLSSCHSLLTWSNNEKVLDVGCGPGDVTATVVRSHLPPKSILVGGDISEDMIKFAKSKYEDEVTQFQEMDITSENLFSSWNKNEFTKIVSFYALHRITNLKQAFKNIFDLLKPGGEIVLQFITNDHPVGRVHQRLVNLPQYASYNKLIDDVYHFQSFTDPAGLVKNELTSVNFEIIRVEREPRRFTYTSMDAFMSIVTSVSPLVHKMAKEEFKKGMTDARKLVETQRMMDISDKGEAISNYTIVVAVARKPKNEKS